MPTSNNGLNIIKDSESCSLIAYPDPESELGQACEHFGLKLTAYQQVPRWQLLKANPVTIGWGHTGPSVKLGDKISQETADALLRMDVHFAEYALFGIDGLNQNQFDALVSLVYNIGGEEFNHGGPGGGPSHILLHLRAGDYPAAANEFLKWDHSKGRVVPGLLNRRKAEQTLFLSPVSVEGAA